MGRKTKVALTVGVAGVAAWAASKAVVKPKPRISKRALAFEDPVVLAKCSDMKDVPDMTMTAFKKCAELGVHGFSVDIRLTKDEEIVLFHDEYLDRITDFSGKICNYTLAELQQADAGYMLTDKDGNTPYRGTGERIVTLKELLLAYPQLLFVLNLMDSPDTYEGSLMPSKLWRLLEESEAEDRVIVTSNFDEQTDRFNLYAQNKVATGAGKDEVKKAFGAYSSKFGHLYTPHADLFIIPEKIGLFRMNTESFMSFLSNLNVAVYYENVNDKDTIEKLLNAGAAGFITNHAEAMLAVMQQINY